MKQCSLWAAAELQWFLKFVALRKASTYLRGLFYVLVPTFGVVQLCRCNGSASSLCEPPAAWPRPWTGLARRGKSMRRVRGAGPGPGQASLPVQAVWGGAGDPGHRRPVARVCAGVSPRAGDSLQIKWRRLFLWGCWARGPSCCECKGSRLKEICQFYRGLHYT